MSRNKTVLRLVTGLSALALIGTAFWGYNSISQYFSSASASGINPVISPDTRAVSTGGTTTFTYNTTPQLNVGSQIQLIYDATYTGTLTTANTTVNTVAPTSITNNTASGRTTSTITINSTITAGSSVTISTTALTTPSTAGNYNFTILSGGANSGATLQYVGQYNVVNVRAFIPVTLSFNIRNTADNADTNLCDLGTVSTAAIASCQYKLKVATNASSGYTVSMQASGSLTNGTYSITNAASGPTGSAITAGTEMYGVDILPGSITGPGGTMTLASAFQHSVGSFVAGYNQTSPTTILTATRGNSPAATGENTNISTVIHRLAIDTNTPAGYYTQSITYKVAPSF